MIKRKIILVSGECPWNCYFCGYGSKKHKTLSVEELKDQIDNYFKGFKKGKIDKLKVDTYGSFLNKKRIPGKIRKYLIDKCKEYSIEKIEVETRPEFIKKENLIDLQEIDTTLSIGLDVADDYYLRKLNKGFTVSDYEDSVQIAKSMGFNIKTFVLVNPPLVDDKKEILDKTVREALKFSDKIVLVNCYLHRKTELEQMLSSEEEEINWEPLTKEEFFDLTKNWLVKSNINYDTRRKEVPPTWKAWIPRFSEEEKIVGNSEDELVNSQYEIWQKFLTERYNPPESRNILLFLPDSDTKPFSKSKIHKKVDSVLEELKIKNKVHKIIISSPGVIPQKFEDYYPFESYEWDSENLDEGIQERYVDVTKKRVKNYIESHRIYYEKYFKFFKTGSLNNEIMKKVSEELDIEIKNCTKDAKNSLKSEETLKALKNVLKKA